MDNATKKQLIDWAGRYKSPVFIVNDPIQFPRKHIGKRAEISGLRFFGNHKAIN